ncbi:nitroreductase family deazaflavin-dependent oxidoreductase [Streptomyces sp. NPDC088794]|uniref:nitroreductase family deazaflavin-dependent oxidoreductase n=1 Tax=Streptomyces sp. NPDC088794 TaxID=3365902 RepID=UPI0037F7B879
MADRDTGTSLPQRPTGWRRLALRLPVLLFRAGLGPLLGKRLLLLHHTGRLTDRDHMTALEVVTHDPATASWTVASGFGPKADWYRNLRAQPKTLIQVGNRPLAVTAHFLAPEEGADIMAEYACRHPRTARRLCTFMSLRTDGTEASYRKVGREIPFVRLAGETTRGHTRRP